MENMMIHYLPKEKVFLRETEAEPAQDKELSALPQSLFMIEEIEPAAGIEFCGDAEDYLDALAVFTESISEKADRIQTAFAEKDMENYITLVHSLKSTARAVGALKLSDLALTLEQAGKGNDLPLMEEKTPELLRRYRGLQPLLEGLYD